MCGVDWALVTNLLAALGSCGAAIVAVAIATTDRRERRRERLNAAKAQATLVLIDIRLSRSAAAFGVDVSNLGAEPILGVCIESAQFRKAPETKPRVFSNDGPPKLKVVAPDGKRHALYVEFLDEKGRSVIPGAADEDGNFKPGDVAPSDLTVTVRFEDAGGNTWLRTRDSVRLTKA